MSMTKYGAQPPQTSKTASGNPGSFDPNQRTPAKQAETLKEKLEREKRQKG